MMRLFKKNREIQISPKYYLLVQDKWAKKMSILSVNLSKMTLIIYLTLFIIIAGGTSIYNVCNGFSSKEEPMAIEIISNTTSVRVKPVLDIKPEQILSNAVFENIIHINFYLDTLKQSKEGHKVYDSIQYYRPGLLDSLDFMTKYYKTNFKK